MSNLDRRREVTFLDGALGAGLLSINSGHKGGSLLRSNVFGWPAWKLALRLSFLTAVLLVSSQSQFVLAQVAAPASEVSNSSASRISIFPLADIRPGMRGIGKTVFKGNKVEEFQVEILGVLRNVAPRQNMILARLSGGPLERTGVMAGMSGPPDQAGNKRPGVGPPELLRL